MELVEGDDSELPLARLFDTASARVMDFLLMNEGLRYTEAEMAEITSVPPRALRRSLQALLEERVIRRSRKGGECHYAADLSSKRTAGLLGYMEATLMDNLESLVQGARRRQRAGGGAPSRAAGRRRPAGRRAGGAGAR